jgi:hypothetical protein
MQFLCLKVFLRSLKTSYNSLGSATCWQGIHFPLFTGLLYMGRYTRSIYWKVLRSTTSTEDLDYSLSSGEN